MNQIASTGAPDRPPRKRRTRTKQALCDALLSLIEQKPFEKITVREITTEADIGYATFFRHYTDKEELLQSLAAEEIDKLLAMTVPIIFTVDSLASAQALCAYLWKHRSLWTVLLTGGAATQLKEEFARQIQEVTAYQTNTHAWLPGDLSIVFAVTATLEILTWWLKQEDPPPAKQIAEILDRLVVSPCTEFADSADNP